jgi:cell division protein FtsB
MLLMGIVLALGGWNLTQTFTLSTGQVVGQEKVDKLEAQVERLTEQIADMKDMDEDIVKQHRLLFEALEDDVESAFSY